MILAVRGLKKTYRMRRGVVEALKGISIEVDQGEILGLLGPNGVGKTTAVKIVCGLIVPDCGEICIEGRDFWRERVYCLARIGAVLEGSRNIHWRLTPWENLMLFGARRELPRLLCEARAQELIAFFHLVEKKNALLATLSRGMQQKVALACALMGNPKLLLLDEPTLGLDVQSAELVKQRVKQLAHEEGTAVLLTTHQMELAEELCDRIAIIDEGRVLLCEPISALVEAFRQRLYVIRVPKTCSRDILKLTPAQIGEHDRHWALRVEDDDEFFQTIRILEEQRLEILSVNTEVPDLREIFLKVTSKP